MFSMTDLQPILAELWILGMASLILVVGLYVPQDRRGLIHFLSLLTLAFAAILSWRGMPEDGETAILAFADSVVRDRLGDTLKLAMYAITALVLVYAKPDLKRRGLFGLEYYVLVLFALLGMMVLVSARNLIGLYLGVELLALCSYGLVALDRDSPNSAEAAMKYFVLGALASGVMLYGMSMLYGGTGSLDLPTIAASTAVTGVDPLVITFGLAFTLVGIAFKLGAVPFHMWLPDVYQGAPTASALFIASVPKLAAFALAVRLLVDGLVPLQEHWQAMVTMLAIASVVLGNLAAIAQTSIKRMLAYSTVSHVGFLLFGILTGTQTGYSAALFYAMVYALTAAGAFAVLIAMSREGHEVDDISQFSGLSKRDPVAALVMMVFMASLAGLPLFAGFIAKFMVIKALVDASAIGLAVIAVLFSVIGLFYYLRVIKLMYFDEPQDQAPLQAAADFRVLLGANALATVALGILPNWLLALCAIAVAGLRTAGAV